MPTSFDRKWTWSLAPVTGLLVIYLTSLAPTITIGDSGELVTAATTLGIPHPPGYPLWCLLMYPITQVPGLTAALCANLGTALLSVLASWLLYRIATGPCGIRPALAAALTLVHGLGPILWGQSVITEVYALNLVLVLWLALLYLRGRDHSRLLPYVAGLAIISHPGNLAVVLPVAWGRVRARLRVGEGRRALTHDAIGLAVGLSPLLYLPLRSHALPVLNWGHPADLPGLLRHLGRTQYGSFAWPALAAWLDLLWTWIKTLTAVGSILAWPLAAWAIAARRRSGSVRTLTLWLLLTGPVAVTGLAGLLKGEQLVGVDVFLLPSVAFFLLLAGGGIEKMVPGRRAAVIAASVILFGWGAWLFTSGRQSCDRSGNWIALDYGRALLVELPRDAVLFAYADRETFPIMYLQKVLGERPDVTVRTLGGPPDRDVYWHPVVPIDTRLRLRDRPIFTTIPHPPFAAATCVPHGLAYQHVPQGSGGEAAAPRWRPVTLRFRPGARLGYFERAALASVDVHHAAYLFATGKTDSALIVVDRAASAVADNAWLLTNLGTLLANVGELGRAEVLWRRAVAVDPELAPARANLEQLRRLRRRE